MVLFEILFACFLAMLGLAGSVLTTFYSEWVKGHPWMVYAGWGCLVGAFVFLLAAILQWRKAHARLTIHWARWYGDDPDVSQNKDRIVRGWINSNSIHHYVHEDELGAEPRGQAKKLEILYSLGEVNKKTIVVANGKTLIIPEPFS